MKSRLHKLFVLLPVVFLCVLGFACYAAVLYLLRAEEIILLCDRVKRKLAKGRTPSHRCRTPEADAGRHS